MLCCFFLRQASKAKNSTIFTIIRWDDWLTERLSGRLISQCIKINIGPLDVVPSNHRIKYIEDCRISKQISNSMNHKKEPLFFKAKVLYILRICLNVNRRDSRNLNLSNKQQARKARKKDQVS